jgi:hypothetical protein
VVEEQFKSQLRCTLYVGTAIKKHIFDPDRPEWTSVYRDATAANLGEFEGYYIKYEQVFVPRFHCLNQYDESQRLDATLASVALPFGLLPAVKLAVQRHIDAGLAVNPPLFPLVEPEGCEELLGRVCKSST